MMTPFEMVQEFHRIYSVNAPSKPTLLDHDRMKLRYSLIREEFREYREAVSSRDLAKIAKELADLMYMVAGTAVEHGFIHFDDIFAEVHRSNLSKLGKDGKPIYREDGKVIKGPDYFEPNLEHLI